MGVRWLLLVCRVVLLRIEVFTLKWITKGLCAVLGLDWDLLLLKERGRRR
jgi:hypothetical protein